jgi:putative endonuclease
VLGRLRADGEARLPGPAVKPTRTAIGRHAEDAAAAHLAAQGWTILARNMRVGALEIDLVVRRGPLVAIVEVRTRAPSSFAGAFASVAGVKRARLLRAADRLWRFHLRGMEGVERVRIDVCAVSFGPDGTRVEHHAGAITG